MDDKAVNAIAELAKRAEETVGMPVKAEVLHYTMVPPGYSLVSLEAYQNADTPRRIEAEPKFVTAQSWLLYWDKFHSPHSLVFANQAAMQITAKLDYHGADEDTWAPSHCTHSATLALKTTAEWKAWTEMNGKEMAQDSFARFIETNACDIAYPNAATFEDMSRDLVATCEMTAAGRVRMETKSVSVSFTENVSGKIGTTQVEIPKRFTIRIQVIEGGPMQDIVAMFRYRIAGGKLVLSYELHRAQKILDAAFLETVSVIEAGIGQKVLMGAV